MKSPNFLFSPLWFFLILGSGCASVPKANPPTPQSEPTPRPTPPVHTVTQPIDRPAVIPAVYKRYYVGLLSDGPRNRFAHPPSELIVREDDDRWAANASPVGLSAGPTLGYRSSAFHPEPLPGEVQAVLAQASATVEALAEENNRLKKEVEAANAAALAAVSRMPQLLVAPALNFPAAASLDLSLSAAPPPDRTAPSPVLAAPVPPLPEAVAPGLISFSPSAENTVEVTADLASQSVSSPRIPFEQVYFPAPTMGEVKFRCSVVVPGPDATAVLNRKIYAPGELIGDGFTLLSVDEDGVWLRHSFFRVRIPFQDQPVSVRFPKEL